MSEKLNIQELAALLAGRSGISKKEAEAFIKALFENVEGGILTDQLAKIKNFGTFKLIKVNDRESVDVNTGERVLLPSRYKLNFTADKHLAQAINEPFALFEPVEITNESLLADNTEEAEVIPEVIPEPITEIEPEPEISIEEREVPEEIQQEEIQEEEPEEAPKKRKLLGVSIAALVLIALGAVFYFGEWPSNEKNHLPQQRKAATKITPKTVIPEEPVVPEETIAQEEIIAPEETIVPKEVTAKPIAVPTEASGYPKERKLEAGERLTILALEEYGDKVFWVYIYEENKARIPNPNNVVAGTILTIPAPEKYGIDKNNPESVNKAQAIQSEFQ